MNLQRAICLTSLRGLIVLWSSLFIPRKRHHMSLSAGGLQEVAHREVPSATGYTLGSLRHLCGARGRTQEPEVTGAVVAAWGTPGHFTAQDPPLCAQLNEPPNFQVLIPALVNLPMNTLNNHTQLIALIRIKVFLFQVHELEAAKPSPAPLPERAIEPNARARDCSQRESQLRATFQCLRSSPPTLSVTLVAECCKAAVDPRERLRRREGGECQQ